MKRPEGFDKPATSRSAPAASTPKKSASTPKKASAPSSVTDPTASRPGKPDPVTPPRAKAQETTPPKKARAPRDRGSERAARADQHEAAKQLRRAEAARRRYERGEVRRFTRRSRRRRITVIVVIAAFAATGALVTAAVYSPVLSLKTISVTGTVRVDKAAVVRAVDSQLGKPLALVDFDKIHAALAKFPLIRSYVTESVPPDTLVIRISERTPIGVIQTAKGFTVVDAAGVEIQQSDTRPAGLPIITSDAALTKSAAFTASVQVLLALPSTLLATVDSITAHTTDDVAFTLTGGQTVTWGSADQSALKAQVLADLIKSYPSANATYNVSAPTQAVVGAR